MRFFFISTLLLGATALPQSDDDEFSILKYRNWDLRLSAPGCNPNETTNFDISLYHRSGVYTRDCISLLEANGPNGKLDLNQVDSVSWKNPRNNYDLCMYPSADCSDTSGKAIRNGWEECFPYDGWKGFRVVNAGDTCTVGL